MYTKTILGSPFGRGGQEERELSTISSMWVYISTERYWTEVCVVDEDMVSFAPKAGVVAIWPVVSKKKRGERRRRRRRRSRSRKMVKERDLLRAAFETQRARSHSHERHDRRRFVQFRHLAPCLFPCDFWPGIKINSFILYTLCLNQLAYKRYLIVNVPFS